MSASAYILQNVLVGVLTSMLGALILFSFRWLKRISALTEKVDALTQVNADQSTEITEMKYRISRVEDRLKIGRGIFHL